MNFEINIDFITGLCLGVEWTPYGSVFEDAGCVAVDLGIIRVLVFYS